MDSVAVLDVGSGPSECVACELEMFGAESVTAIDLDPKMVAKAQAPHTVTELQSRSATSRTFSTRTDTSLNFAVLHHISDW